MPSPLFWSGPEFWPERILKPSSSGSKFYPNLFFSFINHSSPFSKKQCFLTLQKHVFETKITSNQFFSQTPLTELTLLHPALAHKTPQLSLNLFRLIYQFIPAPARLVSGMSELYSLYPPILQARVFKINGS